MNYKDIMQELSNLKKEYGRLITNIVPGAMRQDSEYEILRRSDGMIVKACEPYRTRGYFAAKNEESLEVLMKDLPENIIFEWIYRDENVLEEIMERAGLSHYATFVRRTRVWRENPYRIAASGQNAFLQELYDPDFGEYAKPEDAKELWELSCSVFDVNCDDVFTIEEWEKIIARREVLVGRVGGRIVACYVWRLEGNKLYSNISINLSSADILYNLERRIFDEMWDRGIRVFYAWKNMENYKAMRREGATEGELLERMDVLYNAIYKS